MINCNSYLDTKKEFYEILLKYFENEDFFQSISSFFETNNIYEDKNEIRMIFHLLVPISNNHNRSNNLIDKINNIIFHFKEEIQQNFSNDEIFHIFQSNKLLLLFLFQNSILIPTIQIADLITNDDLLYFYPEFKQLISENQNLKERIQKKSEEMKESFDSEEEICNFIESKRI